LAYYGKRCYRIRDVVIGKFILKMEGNKKMKVKNKFIIGVATLLSMGVLLASPVKAGVDEDEAARLGISSVEEYRRLRDEAMRLGFHDVEELRAAIAAGFDDLYGPGAATDFHEAQRLGIHDATAYREFVTERQTAMAKGFMDVEELRTVIAAGFDPMMYGPTAAQDFREFLELREQPEFQEFLAREGVNADSDSYKYKQFLANRQREQEAMMQGGFHDVMELRTAIAAGFDPMMYGPTAAQDFREFLELREQPEFQEFLARRLIPANADAYREFLANRQREQKAS
jgi:hypothetical protein